MERNAERMKKEDCTLERLVTTIPLTFTAHLNIPQKEGFCPLFIDTDGICAGCP